MSAEAKDVLSATTQRVRGRVHLRVGLNDGSVGTLAFQPALALTIGRELAVKSVPPVGEKKWDGSSEPILKPGGKIL